MSGPGMGPFQSSICEYLIASRLVYCTHSHYRHASQPVKILPLLHSFLKLESRSLPIRLKCNLFYPLRDSKNIPRSQKVRYIPFYTNLGSVLLHDHWLCPWWLFTFGDDRGLALFAFIGIACC